MTVNAINSVSPRCTSRLLLGQGYNDDVIDGEDAVLTTINIDHYSTTSAPATPFNIYASDGGFGLSIDLKDSLDFVPLSFYMSDLPYDPVTHLWFTGVNNISGQLYLYDAVTDSERRILDGICLDIETPGQSHQARYYIRGRGFVPQTPEGQDVATDLEPAGQEDDSAVKFIRDGHVLILRNGRIYTMLGQQIQ